MGEVEDFGAVGNERCSRVLAEIGFDEADVMPGVMAPGNFLGVEEVFRLLDADRAPELRIEPRFGGDVVRHRRRELAAGVEPVARDGLNALGLAAGEKDLDVAFDW